MQIKIVFLKDWDLFAEFITTYIRVKWLNVSETFEFRYSDELYSDIINIFVEILTAHLNVKGIDYKLEWEDEQSSEMEFTNKWVLKLDIYKDIDGEKFRTFLKDVLAHLEETLKPHWPLEAWLESGNFEEMPEEAIAYKYETIKEFITQLGNDFISVTGNLKIGPVNIATLTIQTTQRKYRIVYHPNDFSVAEVLEGFLNSWEKLYIHIKTKLAKGLKPLKAIFKDDVCIGFTSLYKGIPTYVVSDLSFFKTPNRFQITEWPEKIKVATSHFSPFILEIPSNVIQGESNQWIIFQGKAITKDLLSAWEG